MLMSQDESLLVIRSFFTHVDVLDIVVAYDALADAEVAKVVVSEDQIAVALRNNGFHPRQAAIRSGISIEVVSPEELRRDAERGVAPR
jgi:transcription antitermination factor NusA-like protein